MDGTPPASLAHDLRTPLTSIRGFLELLREGELDAEQREYVRVIERNTDRLLELIDGLAAPDRSPR